MKTLATLFLLIALVVMGCAPVAQRCLIGYHQVGCDGKYTHIYWYTGTIYEYPRADYPGMAVSDQKEPEDYIGKDVSINTFPKFANIPWGCYNVMIGGYVLHGESSGDCLTVRPERIDRLP